MGVDTNETISWLLNSNTFSQYIHTKKDINIYSLIYIHIHKHI